MDLNTDDKNSNEDFVFVRLDGMKRKTKWRFPLTDKCPHFGCKAQFPSQAETVKHFTEKHSPTAVWCKICHISVSTVSYSRHFKEIHPNDPLPKDWSSALLKCKNCECCGKAISPFNYKRHMNEMHKKIKFDCPADACDYECRRLANLRKHWKKYHSDLPLPKTLSLFTNRWEKRKIETEF